MGTIADKLTYLNGTKTAIKEAIKAKGVTVTDTDTFRSYATKIGEISGGGAPATKYGCSIDNFLGNVDANGAYQIPTEPFVLDLSSVKSLPSYGLYYKFYKSKATGALIIGLEGDLSGTSAMESCFVYCKKLTSINLSSLTTVSGYNAMQNCFVECSGLTSINLSSLTTVRNGNAMDSCFRYCTGLTSVDLSLLTTVSGIRAMAYCFGDCSKLTSINLSLLTTVGGDNAMNYCFCNCKGLTSVDLSSLTTVSGSSAMCSCFDGCASLSTISFPALTSISNNAFGAYSWDYAFSRCTALTEIHFRADMQATIEAIKGYANKWGASSSTIYFDL